MSVGRRLLVAFLTLTPLPASAAVRLTYQINGTAIPVAWPATAFPIRYVVDRRVADAFPLGTATIDRAVHEWSDVPDARVSFQPPDIVAGATAGKDGQNSITFLDGLFKDQNFLALTTNWYDDSGYIMEGDIQIDPTVVANGYNLQLLVAHETGHLLGLDHSGVMSAVMYPFVSRGGMCDLDSDDRVAIATLYPKADPAIAGATLTGSVIGDSGGIFGAQVVALNENGEPVAAALSDQQGHFVIEGVPPGNYRLYAQPLDGPVTPANFSGIWRSATGAPFPTEFASADALQVEAGRVYGNLVVTTAGSETLNPKWVGAFDPASGKVTLSACPLALSTGATVAIAVGGDGFVSGMTTFDISNPGFHRLSGFSYAGNYVYATFSIAPQAPLGSAVILVKNGSESAALTGALRLMPRQRTRVVDP